MIHTYIPSSINLIAKSTKEHYPADTCQYGERKCKLQKKSSANGKEYKAHRWTFVVYIIDIMQSCTQSCMFSGRHIHPLTYIRHFCSHALPNCIETLVENGRNHSPLQISSQSLIYHRPFPVLCCCCVCKQNLLQHKKDISSPGVETNSCWGPPSSTPCSAWVTAVLYQSQQLAQ